MSTVPAPERRFVGVRDEGAGQHQALLVVGFGGPEGPDEVTEFLRRVTAGRDIPDARLEQVGAHYALFGGVSPINAQTRGLVAAIRDEVQRRGLDLRIYAGNRNAVPLVVDAVAEMAADGITDAIFFATSSFASYSGCRQYREDVAAAVDQVADAPRFDKVRNHGNHPGFVLPMADRLRAALAAVPDERRDDAHLLFTAHSIPMAMADTSDYVAQLHDSATQILSAAAVGERPWDLVFQSRSGPAHVPWLEPDVGERLRELADDGVRDVVVVPHGFVSDHIEVLYDLDVEARAIAAASGIHLVRAGTVGADPRFVRMIVDLVLERRSPGRERVALGGHGAPHDICLSTCCPNLRHPDTAAVAQCDVNQTTPEPYVPQRDDED